MDKKIIELEKPLREIIAKYSPFILEKVSDKLERIIKMALICNGDKLRRLSEIELKELIKKYIYDFVDKEIDYSHTDCYNPSQLHKEYYEKVYSYLKKTGDSKNIFWEDIFSEMYEDDFTLSEIFVRLVEEQYKTKVTNTIQLQELTGIDKISGYYKEDKWIDYKFTEREKRVRAMREVGETFIKAMYYRYERALDNCLNAGGKYKDLLKIQPTDYNLPESINDKLKEIGIKHIITMKYKLMAEDMRPDLREVAKELEAPYSLMLEINIDNNNINNGEIDRLNKEIRSLLFELKLTRL